MNWRNFSCVAAIAAVLMVPIGACGETPAGQPTKAAEVGAAAQWPAFRGPAGDAHVASLPDQLPTKPLWQMPVSGPCEAGIAAAEGVVVICDYATDKAEFYRCISPADGKEIWHREFANEVEMDYGAGPRATPLIHKGKVYVLSALGNVYCFDLKDGKTVWEKKFKEAYGVEEPPQWGFCTSPIMVKDKLIINPGGNGGLLALNPDTGEQLWTCPRVEPNYASFIAGQFGGVEQIIGIDSGSLGGWDVSNGKRLWRVPLDTGDGYICPTPVKVGDKVLVADRANGAKLFGFGKDGVIEKQPVAMAEGPAPEMVTAVATDEIILGTSKGLVAVSAKDLAPLWTDEDEPIFGDECHLIIAQNKGLAMNGGGKAALFTFDKQGVKVLAKGGLSKSTMAHPAIADGKLFVRDSKNLYCYEFGK